MQRVLPVPASRRRSASWGMLAAIDLRAHGPLRLERFGDGDLEGWSAMQFIETSSITIHADEFSGRCFIDVFSCREFDPEVAAAVAVAHVGGRRTLRVLQR
jgi:S-adenosylmethionine/arginine decarboxylase-like enzyme